MKFIPQNKIYPAQASIVVVAGKLMKENNIYILLIKCFLMTTDRMSVAHVEQIASVLVAGRWPGGITA
jgi:glycine betaine/choline ABC-type transport system substrate-binding protein